MPGARVAVTTASTSPTASSTVGTASSAVASSAAKVAVVGTGAPSASPRWLTDTFTVKGSLVTPLRVRVKTAASPSVTPPAEAIETSGPSSSATVTVARLPGAATTR